MLNCHLYTKNGKYGLKNAKYKCVEPGETHWPNMLIVPNSVPISICPYFAFLRPR